LCTWDEEDTLLFRPEAAPKRKVSFIDFRPGFLNVFVSDFCFVRIMAVAQEELHSSLKRIRGECTRVKKKLEASCEKGVRLKEIAVEREKVRAMFFDSLTSIMVIP
jgi:hypothetical protein